MSTGGGDVVGTLNEVVEACKDGEGAWRHAYEHAPTPELKQLFLARAEEGRNDVIELQAVVSRLGGVPEGSGTLSGALHRGWLSAKAMLAGHTALELLEEAAQGEAEVMARYRNALAGPGSLPSAARAVIERQLDAMQRRHAQTCALRDRARAAGP